MNKITNQIKKDSSLTLGLFLILLSGLLYIVTFSGYHHFDNTFTPLFFIHYGIAIIYLVYLMVQKELRLMRLFRAPSFQYHLILLLLFNISAYSLNQTLPVFHESVDWLTAFLIIENILLVLFILLPTTSKPVSTLLLFFFTLAFLFHLHQLWMILPYIGIGLLASPFLGISLHVLVPLGYILALIAVGSRLLEREGNWTAIAIASSCCFLLLGFYIWQWNTINNSISRILHQQQVPGATNELPLWVRLAQTLPDSYFTEKALQTGLIYQDYRQWNNWFGDNLRFEDTKFHDPLLTIASFAGGKIELDSETRIKILDAIFNMRHESADRFWSGLNLKTSDVITNVELFPAYRLAYTEMILRIRNESYDRRSSWFNQEEALYTFQLPEGGTVSSLSLWIGGQEAKARLTTKAKAEQAYNTIVGREKRDPSVVYWMEGNKIRVRVFPCTPDEDRQFKIGITSPLAYHNGELSYSNISFKGPDYSGAKASVNVLLRDTNEKPVSTLALEENGNSYSWSGNYRQEWTLGSKAAPLAEKPFYFQGNAYSLQPLTPAFSPFMSRYIYLDLHEGWDKAEIQEVAALFPNKKFQVYNFNSGSFRQVGADELLQLYESPAVPQFSLFPFHKVHSPEYSLVISKGNKATPNLSDIDETLFSKELFHKLESATPVAVFDLYHLPSDYIRSLREFKVISYAHGSLQELQKFLQNKQFPAITAEEDTVPIASAGIMISRKVGECPPAEIPANAPDHLLRLFSYNQVLKNIGRNYFNKEYLNQEIIKEATLGNVVTPISSLIVLEILHDYERFGINENKDSLGNAAINASGAVPEPHEWALIILGFLFFSWMWFFRGKKLVSR